MPIVSFSSTPNSNALRCDAPGANWLAPKSQEPGPAQVKAPVKPDALRSYHSASAALAASDHFAHDLLLIPGITGVLIHADWLTVSKTPQAKWPPIKRAVTTLILAISHTGQP